MTSYPRTRPPLTETATGGSAQSFNAYGYPRGVNYSPPSEFVHKGMNDYVMAPPYVEDHQLSATFRTAGPMYINGTDLHWLYPTNQAKRVWNMYRVYSDVYQCPPVTSFDAGYWKTKALSNIDPGKPVVDLPLFLFEFKDFPRMLRDIGRLKSGAVKASDVPDQVLAYNFGWAPLVSDVMNLLGLQKATEDRIRYLKRLKDKKVVKRRLTKKEGTSLSKRKYIGTFGHYDGDVGQCWNVDVLRSETLKVWYTANAELVDPLPNDPSDLRFMAFRQVAGLTAQPERLWNFVPWTWLIDYFANVGDYMSAWGGTTRLKTSRMCIMYNAKVVDDHEQIYSAGSSLTGKTQQVTEVLGRLPYANPTPVLAQTPFLNGTQLTNLGALITSKALKR